MRVHIGGLTADQLGNTHTIDLSDRSQITSNLFNTQEKELDKEFKQNVNFYLRDKRDSFIS